MSNQSDARVILARRALRELSRDLSDPTAKLLCNHIDRALRTESWDSFETILGTLPELVRDDTDPWAMRERIQVISLIRFPVRDLDPNLILSQTRDSVSSANLSLTWSDLDILRRVGNHVTEVVEQCMSDLTLVGRHGPGVVAETGDQLVKRQILWYNPQLRPFSRLFFRSPDNTGGWLENKPKYTDARVLMVPKDHKTLRMISAEPAQTQFVQQAVRSGIEKAMRRHKVLRHIDISNQQKQRDLLKKGRVATIDLSCASDTIRVKHLLLLRLPLHVREFLLGLRTPTQVFKGRTLPTQGLYPMGAAVCFPFETMLFFLLAREYSLAETGRTPRVLGVYGDDIVVDDHLAGGLMSFLSRCAFTPNRLKSFVCGDFFETCGVFSYKGVDVSPIKMKKLPPVSDRDLRNLSFQSYAERAERYGYTHLSEFLRSQILFQRKERWNNLLQRREESVLLEVPQQTRYSYCGYFEALISGRGQVPTSVITTLIGWQPLRAG